MTRTPTVWPAMQADDVPALIDYLVATFGFVETARYGGGDGEPTVAHAELLWPDGAGGVMIGSRKTDGACPREPGTANIYVVTAEPEAGYARAREHGADIVSELVDTDYGSREFGVRDPEGNLWTFGSYTGHPATD